MEMVRSHTERTAARHNSSGLVMESPWKKRKRKTKKHVDTRAGDID
jgi:hypothetical protein